MLFWICFIFNLFKLPCISVLTENPTLPYLCGWPVCSVTSQQLCVILSNLYINLCCKTFGGHTEYLDLLLQWAWCSDAAAAQAEDRGSVGKGGGGSGWEQRSKNNPGNEAARPESAGISSDLDVLCQWDSFVLVTCCYTVTSRDCCCALKWSYFCANKGRSRWTHKSAKERHSSAV